MTISRCGYRMPEIVTVIANASPALPVRIEDALRCRARAGGLHRSRSGVAVGGAEEVTGKNTVGALYRTSNRTTAQVPAAAIPRDRRS